MESQRDEILKTLETELNQWLNEMDPDMLNLVIRDLLAGRYDTKRRTTRSQAQLCNYLPETPLAHRQRFPNQTPQTGRRVTLRKSSIQQPALVEPLLQESATMIVPLSNDLIVDLDPTVSLKDIQTQLGAEEVEKLQQSLLRFKEQTEALLAQFGV